MGRGKQVKAGIAYGLLFGIALFLLFYHLDSRLLWGDEAETALLTKNVLRFGIPRTVDGANHITVLGDFRDENSAHVWTWAPWLQEYVAATAYVIFGQTTWASRAPFAAIGWLSVVSLAFVAFRIYRDHRVALASALLLATSEMFLLHARQCRYYSIPVFAEIVLVYGAYQLLTNRKGGVWLLAAGLTLQFYTNYIVAAANVPLLVSLVWFVYRQRRGLRGLAVSMAAFTGAALPWLLYAQPWHQSRELVREDVVSKLWYYISEWNFHFVPWIFLLLPLLGWVLSRHRPSQENRPPGPRQWLEQSLLALIAGYFVVLILPPAELRYMLPLLPVGCLLLAVSIFRYIRSTILSWAVIFMQAMSNAFAMATTFGAAEQHTWRLPLSQYAHGIAAPYRNRFADVLDFFSTQARAGQTVWVADPEFPLIFYTGLKVIDARFAAPETLPDWILPESASGLTTQRPLEVPESVVPSYERLIIRVHDSERVGSVPQPDAYEYDETKKRTDFVIYKKKR